MPASGQGLHPSDSIRAQAKNLAQVFTAKDAKVAKKEGEECLNKGRNASIMHRLAAWSIVWRLGGDHRDAEGPQM